MYSVPTERPSHPPNSIRSLLCLQRHTPHISRWTHKKRKKQQVRLPFLFFWCSCEILSVKEMRSGDIGRDGACPLRDTRIALVLRGQAFRGARTNRGHQGPSDAPGCPFELSASQVLGAGGGASSRDDFESTRVLRQLNATSSLLTHIIEPLERCSNTVEVVLTECSSLRGCPLISRLEALLGNDRIVARSTTGCVTQHQSQNVRLALDLLKRSSCTRFAPSRGYNCSSMEYGTESLHSSSRSKKAMDDARKPVADNYGLVLILRHDLEWRRPITSWRGLVPDRINFAAGCETRCPGCERVEVCHHGCTPPAGEKTPINNATGSLTGSRWGGGPRMCIQDPLQVLPGSLFPAFDYVVGLPHRLCWEGRLKSATGHKCYSALDSLVGSSRLNLVLKLDEWRPKFDVVEPNPLFRFIV
jgi:hypothetical protein